MDMKKDINNSKEASTLRHKAEELLKEKRSITTRPLNARDGYSLSEADILKLNYELEVHQIELELQNEALIQERSVAQDQSLKYKNAFEKYKDTCEKYTELYDFAPSGYFTLSREGVIINLNLNGAKKLCKARTDLKNSLLGFFVSDDTRPVFNLFLAKIFNSEDKITCKVTLTTKDH